MNLSYVMCSTALGLVYILVATGAGTMQRGLKWNMGPRDGTVPPLQGIAGRLDRANKNFLETFPLFIGAVLAVFIMGKSSPQIELGTQLYFWGRVIYLPLYAWGVPVARTLAWTVSIVGIVLIMLAAYS